MGKAERSRGGWVEQMRGAGGQPAPRSAEGRFSLRPRLPARLSGEARLGVLALPFIVQRNDYQDALGAGLGVTEFAPQGKASEVIRALWGWVSKQLNREAVDHG